MKHTLMLQRKGLNLYVMSRITGHPTYRTMMSSPRDKHTSIYQESEFYALCIISFIIGSMLDAVFGG